MNDDGPDADPESLLRYDTVRTWIDSVQRASLRPATERVNRLRLMQQYLHHVGTDPDTIVRSSRGDAKAKNGYLRQLVQWAATLPGSDRARHDAENTIRGFFMRNGFRVVARPYADVYRRAAQ